MWKKVDSSFLCGRRKCQGKVVVRRTASVATQDADALDICSSDDGKCGWGVFKL